MAFGKFHNHKNRNALLERLRIAFKKFDIVAAMHCEKVCKKNVELVELKNQSKDAWLIRKRAHNVSSHYD